MSELTHWPPPHQMAQSQFVDRHKLATDNPPWQRIIEAPQIGIPGLPRRPVCAVAAISCIMFLLINLILAVIDSFTSFHWHILNLILRNQYDSQQPVVYINHFQHVLLAGLAISVCLAIPLAATLIYLHFAHKTKQQIIQRLFVPNLLVSDRQRSWALTLLARAQALGVIRPLLGQRLEVQIRQARTLAQLERAICDVDMAPELSLLHAGQRTLDSMAHLIDVHTYTQYRMRLDDAPNDIVARRIIRSLRDMATHSDREEALAIARDSFAEGMIDMQSLERLHDQIMITNSKKELFALLSDLIPAQEAAARMRERAA